MKKILFLIGLFAMIFLSGCSRQAGTGGEPELEYKLFINAPDAFTGDVMAMADGDELQLNYLYDTDYNGIAYHPIYRFATDNFYAYEDRGEIIPVGEELESPDLAVGTGSFLLAEDGVYHCFYTGHNDRAEELGIEKECVMHAVSRDNQVWEKLPEDTFYAPEGYSGDDFRDPQVFWNPEEGCYWMLLGARREGEAGGCILRYTSSDLSDWQLEAPYYEQDELYFLECPDVFQMGGYYYLVYSWNNVTYYRMGESLFGPWIKPEYDVFDGNAFYAAKTVEFQGSRYLIGFINRKKTGLDTADYSWAGSICPYELTQRQDKTLGIGMPAQWRTGYFRQPEKLSKKAELKPAGLMELDFFELGVLPETMLLTGLVTMDGQGQGAGFYFGSQGNPEDAWAVLLDRENGMMRYDHGSVKEAGEGEAVTWSDFRFEPGKSYEFQIVAEGEVIVIYLDGRKVLSNRIYSAPGKEFGVFSKGTEALFSDLKMMVPK